MPSPYFRIFNPIAQGEKFDKAGGYTRRWVPELAGLPDKYLHKPWEAPEEVPFRARRDTWQDVSAPYRGS